MAKHATELILIAEIQAALDRGIRHLTEDGRPLRTPEEVLRALCAGGVIVSGPGGEGDRTDDRSR